ncbi:unnamed protein product [Phaedon cochleariae]|uniref:Uncharacterized protein n=1 Tax=Phaedon cochleariae TaxID=80249 RepID=A0A9P0DLC9_PHACE|nr:unnamed protein product [Phaedon cochleariae]
MCSTPVNTDLLPSKRARFDMSTINISDHVPVQSYEQSIITNQNDIKSLFSDEQVHNSDNKNDDDDNNNLQGRGFEITPESFNIPKGFNLSDSNTSIVLPVNSLNVDSLPPSSYKQCTILEGSFQIKNEYFDYIIKENRLINEYYPSYFRNRLKKFVNNVCTIAIKYRKYLKDGSIKIFAICKNNNYRCKKFKIIIRGHTVVVYSSSVNFCHPNKITFHVKGIERSIVKNKVLHKKPSEYKRQSILSAKLRIIESGNLQDIKSDCTLRKIKSEAESHWDRDQHDLLDLCKMQEEHDEYIKQVSMPFNVKVFSKEQFEVLDRSGGDILPVIFFDATGSIVRKPTTKTKRVYLYSAVLPINSGRIFPIFEMISGSHFSKTIFTIFHDFRVFCEEQNNKWPVFGAVVTDFSFANIHAICKACNRINLLEYLDVTFKIAFDKVVLPENIVTIHLCCAHLMKNFSKDINECFTDYEVREFYKDVMASVINMELFNDIEDCFQSMSVLLLSPVTTKIVREHLNILLRSRNDHSIDLDIKFRECDIASSEHVYENDGKRGLHKSSIFYVHFYKLFEKMSEIHKFSSCIEGPTNKYYSQKFFDLLLSKYLPFCPLWTGVILRKRRAELHFSNSYVENYFGHLKNNVLNGNKNLKCSRYLRKSRENVLALYKEFICNIPKNRLTKQSKRKIDPANEHSAQETWNKKAKKVSGTHFAGIFLKKLSSLKEAENGKMETDNDNEDNKCEELNLCSPIVIDNIDNNNHDNNSYNNDDTLTEKCLYCGFGRLDTTTDWVACDSCRRWIHVTCDPSFGDKTYSGSFLCEKCFSVNKKSDETRIYKCMYCGLGDLDNTAKWVACDNCDGWIHQICDSSNHSYSGNFYCKLCSNNLKSSCEAALCKLDEEKIQRDSIERKTRGQRESAMWFAERRKRITASNFGTICKARSHKSKLNIAKSLTSSKHFVNEAMKHGIDSEKLALDAFINQTGYKYEKCGLVIHENYSFLAGSPDGLLNGDGIIEIKCPYKVRECDRNETLRNLDDIDNNGKLKVTSKYYYQIQGLLEVTNRSWCEFVVYTFKGIQFTEKIFKRPDFFRNIMLNKLKEFFFYYHLPTFLNFGDIDEISRKWRPVKDMEFLSNGLVNDINYYKKSNRDYVVATFKEFDCFNQINISDFASLDNGKWLTNFVIDITLNLLNSDNKYQIIPQEIANVIFSPDELSESFLNRISLHKSHLAIPLLINQNHHCLIIIDFIELTFAFMDPFNSNAEKTASYLELFKKFAEAYNQVKNVPIAIDLNVIVYKHAVQKDSFNCGMFCIKFFECILNGSDKTRATKMEQYRNEIKYLILNRSDDVWNRCLICSRIGDRNESNNCANCKRLVHNECLSVGAESFINQNVCRLCAQYFI